MTSAPPVTASATAPTSFARIRVRTILLDEFAQLRTAYERGNVGVRGALIRELAALAQDLEALEVAHPTGITVDERGATAALAAMTPACIATLSEIGQVANLEKVAAVAAAARHWRAQHRSEP